MSDFDASQHEELKKWETGKRNGDLIIGVYKYKGGEPKVGFNRYFENKNGDIGIRKSGRLNYEDLQFFQEVLPDIVKVMTK